MIHSDNLTVQNYIGLTGDKPIRFIVSDVDGTLVNDAKIIDPEVVDAVRAARESGIRVAIASGRAWNEMHNVIDALPCLRYFMCTNGGAYVIDKDENKNLFHIAFDKKQALYLLRKLLAYGVYVEAYVKDEIFGMYPPSRCITPERLTSCICDRREESTDIVSGTSIDGNQSVSVGVNHNSVNGGLSDCETEQSTFFFRPNIRPFILETRTMVCDLLSHMESLDEGPEKIQIFYGDEPMRQRILQDLRDDYQGLLMTERGGSAFTMCCCPVRAIWNSCCLILQKVRLWRR